MRRYLLLVFFLSIVWSALAQSFVLTPDNFKDESNLEKDYITVDGGGKSQKYLYQQTKSFINTYYNNPKNVSSEVENEQIVVDARSSKTIRAIYRFSGGNLWILEYKIEFMFKDGKILFRPFFKRLDNIEDGAIISLKNGIFNKKGEVKKKNANEAINQDINLIFSDFKNYINKSNEKLDW